MYYAVSSSVGTQPANWMSKVAAGTRRPRTATTSRRTAYRQVRRANPAALLVRLGPPRAKPLESGSRRTVTCSMIATGAREGPVDPTSKSTRDLCSLDVSSLTALCQSGATHATAPGHDRGRSVQVHRPISCWRATMKSRFGPRWSKGKAESTPVSTPKRPAFRSIISRVVVIENSSSCAMKGRL